MNIQDFTFPGLPTRVVFGRGRLADLPAELERLGICKAVLLTTPEQAGMVDTVGARAQGRIVGDYTGAQMHTPTDVTDAAETEMKRLGADGLLSVGGGSTTGLGKALALRSGLPHLSVPTTYAGSEMTDILGELADGRKTTRRSPTIRPQTVIYDAALTDTLPAELSAVSGLNAMAHAVEALYAVDGNPVVSLMARDGLAAMARGLPDILSGRDPETARNTALYGAWLCGACLGAVSMALHHKVCHVLGGSFELHHARTHAVVLPHATAYNAPAAPEAMHAIAHALGTTSPARGLQTLAQELGAPLSLAELGMPEEGIETAVDQIFANEYPNPRPLNRDAIHQMIRAAWAGTPISD